MNKHTKVLLLYNFVNVILWSLILYACWKSIYYRQLGALDIFWEQNKSLVTITQSLALCELVFTVTGWTHSPLKIATTQIFSRLFMVYLIFDHLPKENRWIFGCLISWAFIEIIRYTIYGLKQFNVEVSVLSYLRRKAPLILYLTGITSEVVCVYSSLDSIYNTPSLRSFPYPMPNNLNFQIDIYYACVFVLFLYIPGSIMIYSSAIKRSSYSPSNQLKEKSN